MASIVVDSSVVIKWFLLEPLAPEARALRAHAQSGALTLLAPDLIHAELGNIVWKKQAQQGLAAADGRRIIDAVRALPLGATPAAVLLDAAYRIAVTHGRTVYDALYIALAQRESCQFVTADERLVNSVQAALPLVVWLGTWSLPASGGGVVAP